MKSIELVTCISGGIIYAGSTSGSTQFSDNAVGVLICISENDLYVLTLCMCTAIKLTFNLNIVIH